MLTITPKQAAIGATIVGVDLRSPLDDDVVAGIREALLQYEVVFFPNAALTAVEQVQLGRSFGTLQCHVALDSLTEAPEVVVFDTAKKATTAEWWHADVTCSPEPPMGAMLQMVVAPVVLGVLIRWRMPKTADQIGAFGPTMAVVAFTMVSGGIVAASAEAIAGQFGKLAFAALLLHIIGFAAGYILTKVLRYPESIARTVSIEVGMQNGGMASVLARQHFPTMPLAAAATVFSGVIQNMGGGLMAAGWV